MHLLTLLTAMFLAAQAVSPPAQPLKTDTAEANVAALNGKLLSVTRIYIDDFVGDITAKQIQAMVVSSISGSKRFIITENREKADAVLKGTASEEIVQESHVYKDKAAAANGRSAIAADDSTSSTETIHNARAAVRLVSRDGDVIWSTTQESRGAKYKGASADVADKVIRQLMRDVERLQAAAPNSQESKK